MTRLIWSLLAIGIPAVCQVAVTRDMFGIHAAGLGTTTPWVAAGAYRTLGARIKWNDVQYCPSPNSDASCNTTPPFDWSAFDLQVSVPVLAGVQTVIIPAYYAPAWASSAANTSQREACGAYGHYVNNPAAPTTAELQFSGGCRLPVDLATDGSGTDALYKAYITALCAHVRLAYPRMHPIIEMWNEPNAGTQIYQPGIANMVPLVRMAKDAAAIVHTYTSADSFQYQIALSPIGGNAGSIGTSGSCPSVATGSYFFACVLDAAYLGHTYSEYVDVLTFHGYVVPANVKSPEDLVAALTNLQAIAAARSLSQPLIDTEGSWLQNSALSDLDWQAAFVWRWHLLQLPYVARMFWYSYDNTASGTLFDGTALTLPGIAYGALVTNLIGKTVNTCANASGTIWTCAVTIAGAGAYSGLIVWDTSTDCASGCTTTSYTPSSTYKRYMDVYGAVKSIASPGSTVVQIGTRPLFFESARALLFH